LQDSYYDRYYDRPPVSRYEEERDFERRFPPLGREGPPPPPAMRSRAGEFLPPPPLSRPRDSMSALNLRGGFDRPADYMFSRRSPDSNPRFRSVTCYITFTDKLYLLTLHLNLHVRGSCMFIHGAATFGVRSSPQPMVISFLKQIKVAM
jgi:hypothetical protein